MITFDGTSREVCTARRIRTNTPLQALTALNDSAFIETAQYLACRMGEIGGNDIRKQINVAYEMIFYVPIPDQKFLSFEKLYNRALADFREDKSRAEKMAGIKYDSQ